MTSPQIIRNVYCVDPEDRVIEGSCACCKRCWIFVASRPRKRGGDPARDGHKNGTCPFGGPFARHQDLRHEDLRDRPAVGAGNDTLKRDADRPRE